MTLRGSWCPELKFGSISVMELTDSGSETVLVPSACKWLEECMGFTDSDSERFLVPRAGEWL